MKKAEIQEKAQDLCDSSFVKPDPGSHYTAWSSMSTIVKKGLVKRQGNPAKCINICYDVALFILCNCEIFNFFFLADSL